ncbi:MAG: response regulator [Actinomycetes bacterium]
MKTMNVLLVEDDADQRFFISTALSEVEGIEIRVAVVEDGQQALDYLHRRGAHRDADRPDLVLLDLKMPRRTGFEVLEEVRSHPELRTIPVSVLSSSERLEDVEESYRRGTNAYMRKRGFGEMARDLQAAMRFWACVASLPGRPA